jgi:hypothetical protein
VLSTLTAACEGMTPDEVAEMVYAFSDFALYYAKEHGKNRLVVVEDALRAAGSPAECGKLDPYAEVVWKQYHAGN